VLANTVISHVADPAALLREAIRLARPGGQIILHDGDYASMTFGTNMPELDHKMPGLILQAVVANRYIMRDIPRLLRELEVKITHTIGDVVLETALANIFQALLKITGLLQSARDLPSNLSSISGSGQSTMRCQKTRSSDHVITSPMA
jgi:2-polyprenyl-3-methyl-5-hydroxy-6-metoxy-1,4-benzoquinol methylase